MDNLAGIDFGYSSYKGWSRFEMEQVFPLVSSIIREKVERHRPERIYTVGPGSDPINSFLAETVPDVIGLDIHPEQLEKAKTIGIKPLLCDVFDITKERELEGVAHAFVPVMFVWHNLPRDSLQAATRNLAYLCAQGTEVVLLDPYFDCVYLDDCVNEVSRVNTNTFREVVDPTNHLVQRRKDFDPVFDKPKVRIALDYGAANSSFILHDLHPLMEYVNALGSSGFTDIRVRKLAPQLDFSSKKVHYAYQCITAKKS